MDTNIKYPRRLFVRKILRAGIALAFKVLATIQKVDEENIPDGGPLLVVGNHFHFLDPLLMIYAAPWPLEFVGGAKLPNAPSSVHFLQRLFGVIPTNRGGQSRGTLRMAESVLKQKGVIGIFPEGGSWATVLRPARPGTAFLAWRTNALILPVGIDGTVGFFDKVRRGERVKITLKFGKPYGPLNLDGATKPGRDELDEIGHLMMRKIAELIPPERRGFYSDDPAVREAARGTEIYPWASVSEL
jgi:1-acyl-sn-glycerol-3-phosphate acyltransferase